MKQLQNSADAASRRVTRGWNVPSPVAAGCRVHEAWRIAAHAVSPERMARVAAQEKAYCAKIAPYAKRAQIGENEDINHWTTNSSHEGLLKAELILPDNPILKKLKSLAD